MTAEGFPNPNLWTRIEHTQPRAVDASEPQAQANGFMKYGSLQSRRNKSVTSRFFVTNNTATIYPNF
jgi:hypothetical protein